jgi:hypothetical protein
MQVKHVELATANYVDRLKSWRFHESPDFMPSVELVDHLYDVHESEILTVLEIFWFPRNPSRFKTLGAKLDILPFMEEEF